MRISNNYGLPGAIVEAIKADTYDPGESDITVTTLIDPPQIRYLKLKHDGEITEDASNMLWALMGKAMHEILDKAEPSAITEQRLYMNVLGWKLGGQFDRITLRGATLQDYKFASIWEYVYGLKKEREEQLNCLVHLANINGHNIERAEAVMLFRDYSLSKAKYDTRYPQSQIARVNVPVWSFDERQQFIEQRIKEHQQPPRSCTDEERWLQGQKWAVMKKKRKKAIKLHDTEESAIQHLNALGNDHYIEHRPGTYNRCLNYCSVSNMCEQWRETCQ